MKSKEKVQAAIFDRLQTRTGLNMKELDVQTTSVSFDKNLAYATVAIHPKGDTNVTHGMSMNYTLQQRDGKWVVLNAGGAKLGGRVPQQDTQLPAGHPSVATPATPDSNSPHTNPQGAKGPTQ